MGRFLPEWSDARNQSGVRYTCGYCGTDTTPALGWQSTGVVAGLGEVTQGYVLICTNCNRPTFEVTAGNRVIRTTPIASMGNDVKGLSSDVEGLYECRGVYCCGSVLQENPDARSS